MIKKITFSKKIVITILLVFSLSISLFFGESVYASNNQLMITSHPFLDIRSGVVGNISSDTFATSAFQNPTAANYDNHFHRIRANQIGARVDSRHGSTLHHQANEIRVNRTVTGQQVGPRISAVPMITVLTYGQGANPSHWSNNGVLAREDQFVFDFYENSMIETLRRSTYPAGDVWVARAPINGTNVVRNDDGVYMWNQFSVSEGNGGLDGRSYLRLNKLQPTSQSYQIFNDERERMDATHEQITDFTRHNIIIFDTDNANQYHDYVYNQLAAMLIQISYDFLAETGEVPLINMISHSTGGNWNMMFANRFPLNVCTLYAIAAPFKGSTSGNHLFRDFGRSFSLGTHLTNAAVANLRNSVLSPSGMNNVAEVSQARMDTLRNDWNQATIINPNLELVPIAGNLSLGNIFLVGALTCQISIVLHVIYRVVAIVFKYITTKIAATIPFVGWIAAVAIAAWATYELLSLTAQLGGIINHIWNNIHVSGTTITLHDDALIARYSAIPSDYFNNINQSFTKNFSFNSNNRRNLDAPAVAHNVQTMDRDIVGFINNNITMTGIRFEYSIINNNSEIRIDGILRGCVVENVEIPTEINGLPVTTISDGAFENNQTVRTINIPQTITRIGSNAFNNTRNLTTITVSANNQHFGSSGGIIFSHDKLVHVPQRVSGHIIVPSTVRVIDSDAFVGRTNISEISILNQSIVGLSNVSFENLPNLRRINVSSLGTNYFSNEGVLIRRGSPQTIVHVPRAISGHITLSRWLDEIPDLAFEGRTGIREITFLSDNPPVINGTTFAGINRANVRLNVAPSMRTTFQTRGWSGFNIIDQGVTEIAFAPQLNTANLNQVSRLDAIARPFNISFSSQVSWNITGDVNFTISGSNNQIINFTPRALGTIRIEANYMGMTVVANIVVIQPHVCRCSSNPNIIQRCCCRDIGNSCPNINPWSPWMLSKRDEYEI